MGPSRCCWSASGCGAGYCKAAAAPAHLVSPIAAPLGRHPQTALRQRRCCTTRTGLLPAAAGRPHPAALPHPEGRLPTAPSDIVPPGAGPAGWHPSAPGHRLVAGPDKRSRLREGLSPPANHGLVDRRRARLGAALGTDLQADPAKPATPGTGWRVPPLAGSGPGRLLNQDQRCPAPPAPAPHRPCPPARAIDALELSLPSSGAAPSHNSSAPCHLITAQPPAGRGEPWN